MPALAGLDVVRFEPVLALTVRVGRVPVMQVIVAVFALLPESEKFGISTPVTVSSNVTVQATLAAFVGVGPASAIETTTGAVLSIVRALPMNVALNGLAEASMMPEVSDRLRRRSPSPDPVLAVTVLVLPVPLNPVIDAPLGPVDASEKFACVDDRAHRRRNVEAAHRRRQLSVRGGVVTKLSR